MAAPIVGVAGSTPGSTIGTVAAGVAAVTISVDQSLAAASESASSLYKATPGQILTGDFTLVMSDIFGLVAVVAVVVNLCLTLYKYRKRER